MVPPAVWGRWRWVTMPPTFTFAPSGSENNPSVVHTPNVVVSTPWLTACGNLGLFVLVQTIALPYGAQPYGLVFSPVANEALVVLEATGNLIKLDTSSGA